MIAMAVAGVAKAVVGYNAMQDQSSALLGQARQEKDAAQQREIERRRDLMRALSAQSAQAGAAGVEISGSTQGLMLTDIKQNQQDLLTEAANTGLRIKDLRQRAANARRAGVWSAAGGLLETAKGGMSAVSSLSSPGASAGAASSGTSGGGFGGGSGGIYGGQGANL
jgi:hypothetical protein